MTTPSPNTVALAACPDYHQVLAALDRCLDDLGGWERFVPRGARVLLKPNLVSAARPEAAATTHPALVEAVLIRLAERDAKVTLGDSPAFNTGAAVAEACGIGDVVRRYGAEIVEFERPIWRESVRPGVMPRFTVDRSVLDAEVVINLPKLKVHRQLGFTGAVKNLYGCMPGKRKAYYHFSRGNHDFHFALLQAAYGYTVAPHLNIADAVVAMERDGPTGGDPRPVGALVTGTDPAACDAVLAELIQVPDASRLIPAACRELRLGFPSLATVRLQGDPTGLVMDNFMHPLLTGVRFSPFRLARSVWRNHQLVAEGRRAALPGG